MRSQPRDAEGIHGIAVTLLVRPTGVKSHCGQFFFVAQYYAYLTEDPADITCTECLHVIVSQASAPLPEP